MEKEIKKRCVILGSVPVQNPALFSEFDVTNAFVICADAGYDTAVQNHIVPDLVVGDFDSATLTPPQHVPTIKLNVEKDDTDVLAAVREGLTRGFTDFVLLGALGGKRFDHSYANLCVMQFLAQNGCRAVMADEHTRIFMMNKGNLKLRGLQGCGVSVFPFGGASCTVTYKGMKYPLTEETLFADFPLGVSNQITEDFAQIVIHGGNTLMIVFGIEE